MKNYIKSFCAFSLIAIFVLPSMASAQSAADLQEQIQSLLAQLQQLQARLAQVQANTAPVWCHTFSANIGVGSNGDEVANLVTALEKEGFAVGKTDSYDETVASAVTGFQGKYRGEILSPAGLANGTGYVGGRTRVKLNTLYGCAVGQQKIPVMQKPTLAPVRQAVPVSPLLVEPAAPASQPSQLVWTEVSCVFIGFTGEQSCFTTNREGKQFSFSGTGTATGKVYGERNEVLTWKSSCGGYAYTIITGGSEYANFNCGAPASTSTTSTFVTVPSIKIFASSGGQQSDNAIIVAQGQEFIISGTPQGLSGLAYFTGYTRAYIFDSLFNDSCANNEAMPDSPWIMQCLVKNVGAGKIYIQIYRNGQVYQSNVIGVTVISSPTPLATSSVAPSINILSPNGGEQFKKGDMFTVKWTPGDPGVRQIYIRKTDGSFATNIMALGYSNTSGIWFLAMPDGWPLGQYYVEIYKSDGGKDLLDTSDAPFSIIGTSPTSPPTVVPATVEPPLKPSVTVLVPNGGEGWQAGGSGKIAWTTTGISPSSYLYTVGVRNSAGVEYDLLTNTPNDGFEEITVPASLASGLYRLEIKIIAGGQTVFDQSDASFTVTGLSSAVPSESKTASILESLKLILENIQALAQNL